MVTKAEQWSGAYPMGRQAITLTIHNNSWHHMQFPMVSHTRLPSAHSQSTLQVPCELDRSSALTRDSLLQAIDNTSRPNYGQACQTDQPPPHEQCWSGKLTTSYQSNLVACIKISKRSTQECRQSQRCCVSSLNIKQPPAPASEQC